MTKKVEWKEKSSRTYPERLLVDDIIREVYRAGIINWNIYQKALDKIQTKSNGTWMFEQKKKEE